MKNTLVSLSPDGSGNPTRQPAVKSRFWARLSPILAASLIAASQPPASAAPAGESKKETTPIPEDQRTAVTLLRGLRRPIYISNFSFFKDGGSISAKLSDTKGNSLTIAVDGRMSSNERGTAYLNVEYPTQPGGIKLAGAGEAETLLLSILTHLGSKDGDDLERKGASMMIEKISAHQERVIVSKSKGPLGKDEAIQMARDWITRVYGRQRSWGPMEALEHRGKFLVMAEDLPVGLDGKLATVVAEIAIDTREPLTIYTR